MRGRTKVAVGGAAGAVAAWMAGSHLLDRLNTIGDYGQEEHKHLREGRSNPLFETFPSLAYRIPWRPLGSFPTPVEELHGVHAGESARLYVKRDDLSSPLYGGNKVRKLEHVLAEAGLSRRTTLVTLGGIGSNHALATALHGAAHGMKVDLVLYRQPVTPHVRQNLAAFVAAGARVHFGGSIARSFAACRSVVSRCRKAGEAPYFIMVGGTSRLGCLGHVSAGLELGQQVRQGDLPEPDRIYVPLGTCGTAAGLIVGLKLAGLKSRVVAVRVADPVSANRTVLRWLAQDVADFLHRLDPTLPRLRIDHRDFEVRTKYFGTGYGVPTAQAESAVEWARPGLTLETTYTGKTLAACLNDARACSDPQTFLFWNTFSSAPIETAAGLEPLSNSIRSLISS